MLDTTRTIGVNSNSSDKTLKNAEKLREICDYKKLDKVLQFRN